MTSPDLKKIILALADGKNLTQAASLGGLSVTEASESLRKLATELEAHCVDLSKSPEIKRLIDLGGEVKINENDKSIVLSSAMLPSNVLEAFAARLRRKDPDNLWKITVQQ